MILYFLSELYFWTTTFETIYDTEQFVIENLSIFLLKKKVFRPEKKYLPTIKIKFMVHNNSFYLNSFFSQICLSIILCILRKNTSINMNGWIDINNSSRIHVDSCIRIANFAI